MEVSGRRVRRFRMRFRHSAGNYGGSVLPIRSGHAGGENPDAVISCCYCDYKISMFNEPIYRLGRRFSRVMKVWFSVGLGLGVASLVLVSVLLLLQFHPNAVSDRLLAAVFGLSPSTRVSPSGIVHVFISTVISVLVHELGHALAAARILLIRGQ